MNYTFRCRWFPIEHVEALTLRVNEIDNKLIMMDKGLQQLFEINGGIVGMLMREQDPDKKSSLIGFDK